VSPHQRPPSGSALSLLASGEIEVEGRMPWSSNSTFLVSVTSGEATMGAVYKPTRGERPLWDFPGGLHRREAAAWHLSELLGWGLVPETLVRPDAPFGPGSLQRFVDADFEHHYFTLYEDEANHPALRRVATFDLLLNNADRKSGHCLIDSDGHIWAIDNGLSFHPQPKLRTVIWEFAGEPVPPDLLDDVCRLAQGDGEHHRALAELLEADEMASLRRRAEAVARRPVFPSPDPDRRPYPWPLV